MPETLKYSALITPDELKADAINSLKFDPTATTVVDGLGVSYKDVTIRAIHSVTDSIEQHLDRKLIVTRNNDDIQDHQWDYNKALDKWQHYSRHYPLVEIETANVTISNDKVRMLAGVKKGEVDYFAGYRRADQALADLQAELPDLDTLPEILPGDINRVAFRLVMYELSQAKQNSFAVQTRTQVVGQTQTEITKERATYYEDELSKLDGYQYITL